MGRGKNPTVRGEGLCIPLDDTYRIVSDAFNWILERKQPHGWEAYGFYSDISTMLKDYVLMVSRSSNAKSISELGEVIERATSQVLRVVHAIESACLKPRKGE